MLENLEDIILFASVAHKNQMMMDPEVPYLTHLISVASNVLEAYHNGEEKFNLDYALKLAILHDTIEDTEVTYDILEQRYGKDIAMGVLALSKNDNLPYNMQLEDSIERIKKAPREVAIVKLSDRIYNLMIKPEKWSKEKWDNYLKESEYMLNEIGIANKYLEDKLQERISRNRTNTSR
ncbi:MAG: bifunctional (p)ppGpp synthetase/guanosine-3',5'-bis(diphosphate) 3'-pyrophosphohydrolase [Bacilli bacterium]|nr:bifunctional (p)ppGpp synthetase/guanosine-3',5'-bis(diphosphate) 3'-pyrophosphohydrolase [Bacilli bacterium]